MNASNTTSLSSRLSSGVAVAALFVGIVLSGCASSIVSSGSASPAKTGANGVQVYGEIDMSIGSSRTNRSFSK